MQNQATVRLVIAYPTNGVIELKFWFEIKAALHWM